MNLYFKKNNSLFYIAYIMIYVSLFIGDIYTNNILDICSRCLRIFSYIIIIISTFNLKMQKKEILLMGIFLMISLFYALKTGNFYWIFLLLFIYNCKNIEIENIFKLSFMMIIVGVIVVLFFCVIGILPDVLTSRNTLNQINYNRHSFGFYHSNVLPLLMFYLEVYYICMKKGVISNKIMFFFIVIALVSYIFNQSRNALILSVLLSLFIIIIKKQNSNTCKFLYPITILSVPVMSVFSFSMMFLLLKGGVWNSIDFIFSGRFRLAIFKMRRVGIHLINLMRENDFINDNISYVNGQQINTIVIDNGFLYILLRYGVLLLLFYFVIAYQLAKKNYSNRIVLLTIITVFVANFVDNDLVDYSFMPFIFWAFNNIKSSNKIT